MRLRDLESFNYLGTQNTFEELLSSVESILTKSNEITEWTFQMKIDSEEHLKISVIDFVS